MKDVVLLSLSQYECDISFRTEIHLWLRLVFSCDLVVLSRFLDLCLCFVNARINK